MEKKIIKALIVSILFCYACNVLAQQTTQVGRYLTVQDKPCLGQTNLLSQTIQVRFPQNVQTIADSLDYLLKLSGYSLVSKEKIDSDLKITLSKPLPLVDRQLGPMPLKTALITLVGPAFNLIEDPINRTVNFHVKNSLPKHSKTIKR